MELTGKEIRKSYGKKEVLCGIDLTLEEHKIYGLIGRNGAGKTTLLSVLTAQSPLTSGSVTLDGEPVWENKKALSHLCFAREISQMTGSGIAAVKAKDYLKVARTFCPHWDQEMADHLISQFHLDVKKRISKLSKGMVSMLTIIVGLASKADITILDEPTSGLDVIAREKFYQLLMEEYTETNRTFVISTHIIEEAEDIFEDVIILDEGKILRNENTQELLERSFHVSGLADEVDVACAGLTVYHEETIGRSKGVTVVLENGQQIAPGHEVKIQKLNLQKLFVALCEKDEEA